MDASHRLQVRARRDELPALAGLVESACAGMAREDRLRLLLVVEELFCNSLEHGYGGECELPITLELQCMAGACRVLYQDRAPEFDPFAHRGATIPGSGQDPEEMDPMESDPGLRPVGGLGILLVCRYTSWREYRRRDGFNQIELLLPSTMDA